MTGPATTTRRRGSSPLRSRNPERRRRGVEVQHQTVQLAAAHDAGGEGTAAARVAPGRRRARPLGRSGSAPEPPAAPRGQSVGSARALRSRQRLSARGQVDAVNGLLRTAGSRDQPTTEMGHRLSRHRSSREGPTPGASSRGRVEAFVSRSIGRGSSWWGVGGRPRSRLQWRSSRWSRLTSSCPRGVCGCWWRC